MKYVFKEVDERSQDGSEELLSISEYYGVAPRSGRVSLGDFLTRAETLVGYKRCQPGDLAMNIMLAWKRALGVSSYSGIVSPAYAVFRPNTGQIVPQFAHYLLRDDTHVNEFKKLSTGVIESRLRLYPDIFLGMPVTLPPLVEQTRIVNFLDEQTVRIDALIAGKERLSGALEELRLSTVNKAISQGIYGEIRLAATGDEWFKQVPAHWSFCALNYRYEVQLGKMLDEKRITGESLLPYLRNTDVQWNQINVQELPSMDFAEHERARYTVRNGDLLVCEGGDVGRAAIWDGPNGSIGYQKALHRVRPRQNEIDLPRYLFYVLFDSAKRGRFEGRGSATIAHLTAEAFRRFRFPFPPYVEQVAIAQHLEEFTERVDALLYHSKQHIERLREYRSSLISAAVTGQIDINNFQLEAA